MKPYQKAAWVAGGYVVCLLLAFAAVAVHMVITGGPAGRGQAGGGMYAFGDSILFVAVFGVSSLAPTGAALLLLRPYHLFWKVLAVVALALAATGVAAAVVLAAGGGGSSPRLATWAEVSVLGVIVSPLLALAFFVCAAISPHRSPRIALFIAAAVEAAVCAYAVSAWVVFQLRHGG